MMFPLGALLQQLSFELRVPGQDSPATVLGFGSGAAFAGIRFNSTTGEIDVQAGVSPINWDDSDAEVTGDMWIHSDVKNPDRFDASKYEVRFVNVTGDTTYLSSNVTWAGVSYGADDYFHDLTVDPYWYIVATSGLTNDVSGIIQIREKLDTVNSRAGNLTLRATEFGF